MQRFTSYLLLAAAVVGFTLINDGSAMAKGGGGHHGSGGSHSHGSSHSHSKSSHHPQHSHAKKPHSASVLNPGKPPLHPNPKPPRHPPRHRHPRHHGDFDFGFGCGDLDVDADVAEVELPIDVATLAVHMIDAGDARGQLGPAYRVTVRNNSAVDIVDTFALSLTASNSRELSSDAPSASTLIEGMQAGEVRDFDIRLPATANTMGTDAAGQSVPFSVLSAMADSQNQLVEINKDNNLLTIDRSDIPAVSGE